MVMPILRIKSNAGKYVIAFNNMKLMMPKELNFLSSTLANMIKNDMRKKVDERAKWQRKYNIEQSFFTQHKGRGSYIISSTWPGASAAEEGTKPHSIPNNPFWGMKGKIHPGSQGLFYARDAFNDMVLTNVAESRMINASNGMVKPFFDIPDSALR